MNLSRFISLTIMTALAAGAVYADVPSKKPLSTYSQLWQNSPFTSKPPPPEQGMVANPLNDFTLSGIAPVPGGYRITIIHKKNPDMKKVIEPGVPSEFKVISVNRNPDKALGTTVVLASGSIQGTVTFEPDLISLKAAPAKPQQITPAKPQPAPNQAQGNPIVPPGLPIPVQNDPNQVRQPRPRIVPPPQPSGQNLPIPQSAPRDPRR
jgi:hypothetical protein